jgi:hypothetical protein
MGVQVKKGTATVGVFNRLQSLAKAEGVNLATIVGGLLWWACGRLSDEGIMEIYRSLLIARKGTRGGGRKKKTVEGGGDENNQ